MLAVACLITAFVFYNEWKRRPAVRVWARLTASLLAVISLLLMSYPLKEENNKVPQPCLLLTQGFIKDSVNEFIRQHTKTLLFSEERTAAQSGYNVQLVTAWQSFAAAHATDTFHVFGNGLSKETLFLLHPHPLVFHASPAVPAITTIHWNQSVETGDPLQVQGYYENNSNKKVQLVLQAFGEGRDSVIIDAGERMAFQLRAVPVHSGKAVYAVIAVSGNDTLQKEPVPVIVHTKSPLQLLIVAASPDFDNTYLKNHLSQRGYQVTMLTSISKNKKDKQFLNTSLQQGATPLTGDYLSKFDVLLTDQESLHTMTAAELSAIRLSVQNKSMGMVIKMDAEKNGSAFYSDFFHTKALPPGKESSIQLFGHVADSERYQVKMAEPVAMDAAKGTQAILRDAQSNIYASRVLYGSGTIVATTLHNTYSMALAGNQQAYQHLWWLLLNKAAKKINPETVWSTYPFISYVNNPVQLELETNALVSSAILKDNIPVYFAEDPLLPFVRHGVYWPSTTGWQELPAEDSAGQAWYAYRRGHWQSLIDGRNRKATSEYVAAHPIEFTAQRPAVGGVTANRQLYLLLLLLACCIFLWVEQKLS